MIGYKVVKGFFRYGKMVSFTSSVFTDVLTGEVVIDNSGIEYKIKEEAKPKADCGPLCLFDSLHHAMMFRNMFTPPCGLYDVVILKCEYEPSKEKQLINIHGITNVDNIQDIWPGTVLASSITPLEVVTSADM